MTATVGAKRRGSAGSGSGSVYRCGRQWICLVQVVAQGCDKGDLGKDWGGEEMV